MLLEVPRGLTPAIVAEHLKKIDCVLKCVTASHSHEDHLSVSAWTKLQKRFSDARFMHPSHVRRRMSFTLGGETGWLIPSPKHSTDDLVAVFRGVAMTGDIELGTLESVNDEVDLETKKRSFKRLKSFPERHKYQIHTVMSAHCNDYRENVNWRSLFSLG